MLKKDLRILTDIRIGQSTIWTEKTTHIGNLQPALFTFLRKTFRQTHTNVTPFYDLILISINSRNFDVVITANARTGFLVSFFRKILRIRAPKHMMLELMLDEESRDIKWKLKRLLQKYAFSSVDTIFVSSTSEIDTYSDRLKLRKAQVRFLPFHTNIVEPRIADHRDSFILSAGKSGRDYQTLIEAVKNSPVELVVVSDNHSINGIKPSQNTKILINVRYAEYLELIKKCFLVVVPLHRMVKSTGQVVILEAMALGKPVIATDAVGTRGYIQHGLNGILVPPYNVQALTDAISTLMKDTKLYTKLTTNALDTVKRRHTFDSYVRNILKTAEEICRS